MRCGQCDTENRTDAAFCSGCGTALVRSCAACGATPGAGAAFCDRCGARLTDADDADSGPNGSPSLGDRIGAAAAERRLVTVLFADAKGSTALTERIGDEAMYELMQGCVERMQAVVESHRGTVTQFRGDGIMALFGAPVAIEDAAVSGVTAALEMQAALESYCDEVEERVGARGAFRIGLNTGPVVAGRVGDSTLVDYTAIGDTANVAARMEQSAGDGEVYLSEPTWRAVRDFVDCEEVGILDLKGKTDGVRAFRALARRPVRDRFDIATQRGLAPFVGRDDELSLLSGFAHRLHEGRGRVVSITGEAGIGKSRLLRELRERVPEDVAWFEGRASSVDRDAPWQLVRDLLRRALDVREEHSTEEVAGLVAERAEGWSDHARAAVPYVRWLLGVEDPEIAGLDPRLRRAGAFEALVTVVRDAAARRPLVLALEDLHWTDEASEEAVAAVARAVADVPVLLVVTYRPERTPDLGDRPWYTRLALDGLGGDDAVRLATSSLGRTLSAEAQQLVESRAGGNPLFVEELTASLVEGGVLQVEGDELVVAGDAEELDIPESLHDVVLTRIDRLEQEARRSLQLASVIGREFTRRILDRIAQMPDHLDQHLAELESLELIRQRSWYPELEYLFKHAVVHDVTYSTLLDERRRSLHRLVATAMEELYADQLEIHADALARHWTSAGEEERALPHLIAAGDLALRDFVVDHAVERYRLALEISVRLGRAEDAEHLSLALVNTLLLQGAADEALELAEQASSWAEQLGSESMAVQIEVRGRAYPLLIAHRFEEALEVLDRWREPARRLASTGDPSPHVARSTVEATVLGVLGEVDGAIEALEDGRAQVAAADPDVQLSWTTIQRIMNNWRGRPPTGRPLLAFDDRLLAFERWNSAWADVLVAANRGDYRLALDAGHDAIEQCRRIGDAFNLGRLLNTVGWVHGELGDHATATELNRASIDFATPLPIPNREVEANARMNLAEVLLARGAVDEAQAELDEIRSVIREPSDTDRWMRWRFSQRWFCINGEIALRRGDPAAARSLADECLEAAERTDARKYRCRGRRLRARALDAEGRRRDAAREIGVAVELAREAGNPPQLWRTLAAAAAIDEDRRADHVGEALRITDSVLDDLDGHPLAAVFRDSDERARLEQLNRG